ncbi:MAG: response regulator [Lentisphaerae bacterium]|nr:response regulator [Lentisphaerota bacterium]
MATAAEAQHVLRERDVGLVILNLVLPDIDGRTLLTRLRENPLTASIPVLATAAKIVDSVTEEGPVLNADEYMEQPLDEEKIAEWARTRLRRADLTGREARRDPLTGLLNRAAFRESFAEILQTCRTDEEPATLALLSIDGYRDIVEEHGHASADAVLKNVASLLSSSLRTTDLLGRWGKSEFAAAFPAEDQYGGTRAAEKVLDLLQSQPVEIPFSGGQTAALSVGVTLVAEEGSVEEAVSEASRFLFQAKSAGGARVASSQSHVPRHTKRILVLLHDKLAGKVVTHLLEREGFNVVLVPDSDLALEEAGGTVRHHAVVIDEMMPDPGGLAILERVRQMPRYNRVPILMLLSRSSEEGMVRALELGANDYLTRPFSPFTFMSHMHRLLARRSSNEDNAEVVPGILIVSKNKQTLLVAATALRERGGFRICLGLGGADGLQRFDELQPDIVVLDDAIDGMTREAFVEEIEKRTDLRDTSLLLGTPTPGDTEIQRLVERGVKGTLSTPFEPLSIAEDIENALGIPPDTKRPAGSQEDLNAEIVRIMKMKP